MQITINIKEAGITWGDYHRQDIDMHILDVHGFSDRSHVDCSQSGSCIRALVIIRSAMMALPLISPSGYYFIHAPNSWTSSQ